MHVAVSQIMFSMLLYTFSIHLAEISGYIIKIKYSQMDNLVYKMTIYQSPNLILINPVNDKGKIVKMPVDILEKLQLSKI